MTEKTFCDICGKEARPRFWVRIFNPLQYPLRIDVCSDCKEEIIRTVKEMKKSKKRKVKPWQQ